uniref:DNA polymerase theta n=1 Tax=Phlebotomus papatasi TaxID=29031 RepID=A0A1B0DMP4_PHLPP
MAHFSESFNLSLETLKKLENLPAKISPSPGRRLTRSQTQNLPSSSQGAGNSDDECVEASPNNSLEQSGPIGRRNKQRNISQSKKSIRKNKSDSLLGKYMMNPLEKKSTDFSHLDVTVLEKLLEVVDEEEAKFDKEALQTEVPEESMILLSEAEGEKVILEMPISSQDIIDIEFSDWETSNVFQKEEQVAKKKDINEVLETEEDLNIDNVTFVTEQSTNLEMKACRREVSQMIKEFHMEDSFIATSSQMPQNSQISFRKEDSILETSIKASQEPLKAPAVTEAKFLSSWGLPEPILAAYTKKGITEMFQWQVECLSNRQTLLEGDNLVYSAPTSSGKTLVSEILMIKSVLERQKKALLILPFISVVREKMLYLRDLLTPAGIRVEGFFGGYSPPGGFDACQLAVCTIEKANSIFNRLLELQKVHQVGIVVVDEIHLISDPSRGYILELLLAKILYVSKKMDFKIQIVGMSATLPNLELLCRWLSAQFYLTDFRPVELREMIKVGNKILSNRFEEIRTLDVQEFSTVCGLRDQDNVGQLVLETISEGCGVIVFCPSKDWCEKLCLTLAEIIYTVGKSRTTLGAKIRDAVQREAIESVRQELLNCPTGLDQVLARCIGYACAFHHAGLTTEERDAIEGGFRMGALRVLVATSTLSSGVNLPARRVIVRSPMFGGRSMNALTYRQMIGRAGRTGKDTLGEAILICDEANVKVGKELLTRDLMPISSCLDARNSGNLRRALLEIVAAGMATSFKDLQLFFSCTMIWAEKGEESFGINVENSPKKKKRRRKVSDQEDSSDEDENENSVRDSVDFLLKYEFLRRQTSEETAEEVLIATRLGYACLASSIPPSDGFLLFSELQKSRQCFVLESELHAIYLVTPFSVCHQLPEIDWLHFLDLWERLPSTMRRVGELVGVRDAFLVRAMRGTKSLDEKQLQIHKRFYTALALQELISEVPIAEVAAKYKCPRGLLQSLQQMAASFAAIVAYFCTALNWQLLAMIVSQFRERLFFGIHRDLVDLMKIPSLNAQRARALFAAGIETLLILARTESSKIVKILLDCASFDTEAQREGEADYEAKERIKLRKYNITGQRDLTIEEAARIIKTDARRIIEQEMGGTVNWEDEEILPQSPKISLQNDSIKNLSVSQINSSVDEIPCSQTAPDASSKRIKKSQICKVLHSKASLSKAPKINHVTKDEKSFQEFSQRALNCPEVSVGIVIEKSKQGKVNIGAKLLDGEENFEEIQEGFQVDQERILSAVVISCDGKEVAVVDFSTEKSRRLFIAKLFNRSDGLIHMWEVKEKLKLLTRGIREIFNTRATFQDPQVANWLLQPDEATTSLHRIVMLHCPDLEGLLVPATQPPSQGSQVVSLAAAECCIVFNLRNLSAKLVAVGDGKLLKVFRELEMPIQISLFRMELTGFPVNSDEMEKFVEDCENLFGQLEKKIFTLHGKRFNIASSRAVANVLGIAKGKGKVSTAKSVLEKLGTPLSKLIMQHRTLTAVFTKTLHPLARSIEVDRIHGISFSLTQTGRITMHEPNLQTVAKDIQLDFGDENTKILSSVAARWNGIPENKVTPSLRHEAKQICYGIIYGMGARSLSESLKVDEASARERIEGFYRIYPAIRTFNEKILKDARVKGFVETLSGRRRFLEHITSPDSALRAQAERQALNSMIQGSAADVAKTALLAVEKKLSRKKGWDSQFILHLHDELIFEIPKTLVPKFTEILRDSMENCMKLSVPLRVKLKTGSNWAEMTEISG